MNCAKRGFKLVATLVLVARLHAGGEPTNALSSFVVGRMPPLDVPELTLDTLSERWTFFEHQPLTNAGMFYAVLPFRAAASDRGALPEEGHTLAFLLDNALRWVPLATAVRNTDIVSTGSVKPRTEPDKLYVSGMLSSLARSYGASHLVGGDIDKTPEGYTGRVVVYDSAAEPVFSRTFDEPTEFSQLAGDMAIAVMQYAGYAPSPALQAHVRSKRCDRVLSIVELGSLAIENYSRDEASRILQRLVNRDKRFAEARYALAQAERWTRQGRRGYQQELSGVLGDYLIVPALLEMDTRLTQPDEESVNEFESLLQRASQLVGQDAPLIALMRLRQFRTSQPGASAALRHALGVAGKYPNSHALLNRLMDLLGSSRGSVNDAAVSTGIAIAVLQNDYASTPWQRIQTYQQLAGALQMLGHDADAAAVLREAYKTTSGKSLRQAPGLIGARLATALQRIGRYGEAAELGLEVFEQVPVQDRGEFLTSTAIAAAIHGRGSILERIVVEYPDVLDAYAASDVLPAYRSVAAGDVRTVSELKETFGIFREDPQSDSVPYSLLLDAELDIRNGDTLYRREVITHLRRQPHSRPLWSIFDAYDRANATPESLHFYMLLEWMHSDDAWVVAAVAARRLRCPDEAPVNVDEVSALFADYPATEWPVTGVPVVPAGQVQASPFRTLPPGIVTAAVRQLLETGQPDEARTLVLRCLAAAQGQQRPFLRAHLNYLYHTIEAH